MYGKCFRIISNDIRWGSPGDVVEGPVTLVKLRVERGGERGVT